MHRRTLLLAPLAAPSLARAQGYPARPVRVVVPFAAGGIIDVVARILAEPMTRQLGQPVVVENLPGAGATIGARAVARAAPDGYTLLLSGAAHAVMAALYPDLGFDPLADFAPIALLGNQPFVVAVHPSVPARDVPGLLAWLRARKGEANFATTGIGAASHLAGELLKRLAGVEFTTVTYRGTPQAVTDLVAGRADLMIDSQTLLAPLARDGRVRALAVTTPTRSRLLPDLPTLAEAGVAGYAASSWQSLQAPAGTPPAILERLSRAASAALAEPTVQQRYAEAGLEPLEGDPAEAARFLRAEAEKWEPILQATGARAG
ncbi:tripartite tricarboxylate transporter substrate binding protein [Siccirubricoccus sp. G192]|uniref:Bug family tripartite tricarboxylate transporter substrate binding protein n=1 Tax=Siccirubricoccus sp. G192 TaxID=2849651 RepID=UPI001C2BC881|nr:tripartite tricarboxylate transporter substrate binding protein [Siccirubricoccus sp. G192]MBV1797031.1 tripartite tricarboxylate transporter substrate binding protein [Siccirubricoccus sp. G192]